MKKSILLIVALYSVASAWAQSTPTHTPDAKPLDRFWFGAAYTPKFMLGESVSSGMSTDNRKTTVHNYSLEAGYLLLQRLSVGVGVGYERYWIKTGNALDIVPLYLHSSYFYGRGMNRGFFNYVRAGVLFAAGNDAKTGFMGGLGVGYRLKFCNRLGLDFKAGYDYSSSSVNTAPWSADTFRGRNWSRHSLSVGVGLVF